MDLLEALRAFHLFHAVVHSTIASLFSQKFAQQDPWTERVAGKDAHEFMPLADFRGLRDRTMTLGSKDWIKICQVEAIPVLGARVVRTASGCIALFRTAEQEVFALENKCPHKSGPLSQGIVHGRSVTCPLHAAISLDTGKAQGADEGQVRTIPLKVESGTIFIGSETVQITDIGRVA